MKTRNSKIIAIIIALIMLVTLSIPTIVKALSTSEDFKGHLAVSNAEGAVGDNVTVNITATSDMTIENGGLLLEYDHDKLQYVSSTDGSVDKLDIVSNNDDSGVIIALVANMSVNNVTIPSGTIISSITFKILDGGDQTLKLVYEQENNHPELATGTIKVAVPVAGVSLDKDTLSLEVGGEGSLVATVNPDNATNKTVTWTSSNTSVATVENGTVKAVGNGTTTITASAGGFSATCNVTVHTKLTGIKLNKTTAEVNKGKYIILHVEYEPSTADIMPDGSPIPSAVYESNHPEFASVNTNKGSVTGVKQGSATITAKVGEFTATCDVTVKEIPLISFSIYPQPEFNLLLGYSQVLNVVFNPEDTTDDVSNITWESDHPDIVSVEDGMVKGLKTGEATIKATVNGKTAQVKITVIEVFIEGIEIKSNKTSLAEGETAQVYIETNPSEVSEEVNVVYSSSDESIVSVDPETGVIKGLKAGKATIKAVVKGVNGEFTSEIEIEVADQVYVPDEQPGQGEDDVTTPNETSDETPDSLLPNTGDIAIELFVVLMVVSIAGIAFIVIKNRKNK